MNPLLSLNTHVMEPKRLESVMLRDKPVVPPDSVIKTFSHLKGDKIDLVLTQDGEGLCQGSFILRRGEWAKFFLDTWFDPLYRSYNFQKAEGHALVHNNIILLQLQVLMYVNRNMSSNGIPRFSQSLHLCPRTSSTRTVLILQAGAAGKRCTKRATSQLGL